MTKRRIYVRRFCEDWEDDLNDDGIFIRNDETFDRAGEPWHFCAECPSFPLSGLLQVTQVLSEDDVGLPCETCARLVRDGRPELAR